MEIVRLARYLSDGNWYFADDLAFALTISPVELSLAIENLSEQGFIIEHGSNNKYRLMSAIDWLDHRQILQALGSASNDFTIRLLDSITSTNTELLRAANNGATTGTVYTCEWQTIGRGRRNQPWLATLGTNLMFSLLWRFNHSIANLSGLSLVASLAVLRALEHLGIKHCGLKWPNDIYANNAKVAGVLVEVGKQSSTNCTVIIGIGINVALPMSWRKHINQAVCDLSDLGYNLGRNRLLAGILNQLALLLTAFEHSGFAALVDELESRHVLHNQLANLTLADGQTLKGLVRGIASDGSLCFQTPQGLRLFQVGTLSLRGDQ